MKSTLTEYTKNCSFCGKPTTIPHHLLFGNASRKLADEDGLIIPVCENCHTLNPVKSKIHDNPMAEALSKMLGQIAYEKNMIERGMDKEEAREQFMKRYGRSYI